MFRFFGHFWVQLSWLKNFSIFYINIFDCEISKEAGWISIIFIEVRITRLYFGFGFER